MNKDIVVGWGESRETARAIQEAMPLLQRAGHVEVVSINYKEKDALVDVSEISTYLMRRDRQRLEFILCIRRPHHILCG